MDVNLQNTKIELIKWLTDINDFSVLQEVLTIKESNHSKASESLSLEERKSIDRGLKDVAEGKIIPHSEVKKLYEKWL